MEGLGRQTSEVKLLCPHGHRVPDTDPDPPPVDPHARAETSRVGRGERGTRLALTPGTRFPTQTTSSTSCGRPSSRPEAAGPESLMGKEAPGSGLTGRGCPNLQGNPGLRGSAELLQWMTHGRPGVTAEELGESHVTPGERTLEVCA